MEVVIEIDDKTYELIKLFKSECLTPEREVKIDDPFFRAVVYGTPLPKGHGRLIDADEIRFENTEFETYGDYCIAFDAIDQADTIIKADKESNNASSD